MEFTCRTGVTEEGGSMSRRTHGHRGPKRTSEYRAWDAMINRCYRKTAVRYERWGGRGIAVCERWRHSFENFIADMGLKPSPSHSLDRYPNRDGNYEPGNCRWATNSQQVRNSSWFRALTFNGETKTLLEWATTLGGKRSLIDNRLRRGWPLERALTTPAN